MERSIRTSCRVRGALVLAFSICLASAGAHADVTTQERSRLGGALGSLVKMDIDTTTSISGDRARMETKVTCGNALMRMFCPGDSAQIVRLDKDTTWQLDLAKKTWYEESFEDFRKRQDHAAEQLRKAQAAQANEPDRAAAECDLQPATSDVKKSGEKATFAGLDAERTTITVTQACKDRKTGEMCETRWTADQWLTSADVAQPEQQRFWQAYAKKLLRDEAAARTMAAQALAYMEQHKSSFGELANRLAEQRGTPLKYTLSLALGGPGCPQTAGLAAGGAGQGGSPSAERPSVGGTIAGAIGGSLGAALFKRKKKDAEPAAETAPASTPVPAGFTTVFEMTTEARAFDRAAVPADRFEIPPGFKQIAAPALPAQ